MGEGALEGKGGMTAALVALVVLAEEGGTAEKG